MLADKIAHYEATGKMLSTTPAQYKKDYPYLKEVDSLALANVQLHLQTAYKNFFRDKRIGFPKYKSAKRSRKFDKWYPSSQLCSCCGRQHKLMLSDRIYKCECGNVIDRDHNAAKNIRQEGIRILLESA